MNDPFASALAGIVNSAINPGGASIPAFSPLGTNLFGYNLPGQPNVSPRDFFLTQLESWYTSIPLNTQWMIIIDNYPGCVNTSVLQSLERVDGGKKAFDINQAKNLLTAYPLQKIVGCIFAQGVDIPPDNVSVEYANIKNNRGFTPAPYITNRAYPNTLSIDFLDTNTSFTDLIIRPWVIAASHFGFVARNPKDPAQAGKNVKTNVSVFQYTKTVQGVNMIPRKIWRFYNCCPIEVGNRQMTYDAEGFSSGRSYMQTKWVYSHYTLETNYYFPLGTIINQISKGQFGNALKTLAASANPLGILGL